MTNKKNAEIVENEEGIQYMDMNPKKLYKFRALEDGNNLERIKDIIVGDGFYCTDFLGFNDMNEGFYSHNDSNKDIVIDYKLEYKICSFSEEGALSSELMWGHYANAGKGIAIETTVENWDDLHKVDYKNGNDNLDTTESILTRKSTDWVYEEEWRYLKKSNEQCIKLGRISKIYFGMPYQHLNNYNAIQKKSNTLKRYLKLKKELEIFCEREGIECVDYDFEKLHISKEKSVLANIGSLDYTGKNKEQ